MTPEALKTLLASPIAYHRVFATITGAALPGLFLSQVWYWHWRVKDPEGWFYKGWQEWNEETGMSRQEQRGAVDTLIRLGFIEKRGANGFDRRTYFRLRVEAVVEAIKEAANPSQTVEINTEYSVPPIGYNNQCNGYSNQSNGYNNQSKVDNQPMDWLEQPIIQRITENTAETNQRVEGKGKPSSGSGEPPAPAKKEGVKKRPPKYPCPKDFQITDSMRQWAKVNTPLIDPDHILPYFRDKWDANGTLYADWEAGWRTWMQTEQRIEETRQKQAGYGANGSARPGPSPNNAVPARVGPSYKPL